MDKGFYDECIKTIRYCEYALTQEGQRKLNTDVDGMEKMLSHLRSLSSQIASPANPPVIGEITARFY